MPGSDEMTLRECAMRYNLKIKTVKQWAHRGKFPTRRDNYSPILYVTRQDFETFLAAHSSNPGRPKNT